MSDLLAITHQGASDLDEELIAEVTRQRPNRVTILIEGADAEWARDETDTGHELRDRLAFLLAAIERTTRATVVGVACDDHELAGWRFDKTVRVGVPVAA
jgi:transcription elongation GreA/GreB family factor